MVNSYNTLINTLQQFAQHHLGVQRFKTSFFEQLDNFSTGDNNFPILYVVPQDITMLGDVDSLFIRVYCVDILQKDRTNEQFILNDTLLILRDLTNWIRQDATVNYNILNNPRAVPVNNFLVDFTTGWYMDIELESESYGNDCVIPFDIPFNITGLTQDINYALPFLTCDTLDTCQAFLDVQLTGITYNPSNNQISVNTAGGQTLSTQINAFSGLTINGSLSATTYFGDGSNLTGILTDDVFVTGGTYTNGSATFVNNTGGTFSVSGFTIPDNQFPNLGPVLDNTIATPPSASLNDDGDKYIIPSGATGVWSTNIDKIAEWDSGINDWLYYTPLSGDITIVTTGPNAGEVYQYNGATWIQLNVPSTQTTSWWLAGTNLDAGGSKTVSINRTGNVMIGAGSGSTNTNNALRVIGQSLLDAISTRTSYTTTTDNTRTNNWYRVFTYRFPTSPTSYAETVKLIMNDSGDNTGQGQTVDFNIMIKRQGGNDVWGTVIANQTSYGYDNVIDNFDVRYNGTGSTKELRFYYKPTKDNSSTSWTLLGTKNNTYISGFIWNNTYLSASTLNGEVNSSGATISKRVNNYINLSTGGTLTNNVDGDLIITGNTIATTISATTYQNLPSSLDTYVTGFTYDNSNNFTILQSQGQSPLIATINSVSGLTVNGNLNATTISATTYLNLPTSVNTFVTGGTYSNGTSIFTNNSGGTFNVSGYYTGFTGGSVSGLTATTISASTYQNLPIDIRVTGATYANNQFTHTNNTGGTYNVTFNSVTGLTVNGVLSATTISASTLYGNGANITGLPSSISVGSTTILSGATTRVPFNNAGIYGESANFTWNNATSTLAIATWTTINDTRLNTRRLGLYLDADAIQFNNLGGVGCIGSIGANRFGMNGGTTASSCLSWGNVVTANVGIGLATTLPTARLQIAAGTATAGSAPLKFTSGTNLTVVENGATEFNGTNLFFTPSTVRNIVAQVSGSTALISGTTPVATANGYLTNGLILASGTYTPTLTGVLNVTSSIASVCQFMRVGSVVTVSGGLQVTPTSNNTRTTIAISLPIASNFSSSSNCGGTSNTLIHLSGGHGGSIYADPTNDRAELDYYETNGTFDDFPFTFTYTII